MVRIKYGRLLLLVSLLLISRPAGATVSNDSGGGTLGTVAVELAHAATLILEVDAIGDSGSHHVIGAIGILVGTSGLFLNRVLSDETAYFMNFVSLVEIGLGTFIIVKSRRTEASRVSLRPVIKLRNGESEIGLGLNLRF